MSSSFPFLLNSNSNSSSENDSRNDDNNMLECPSDFDDDKNENKFIKSTNQGEAIFLEKEPNKTSFSNSNQRQMFSPNRSKSVNVIDNKQQSQNIHAFSSDDLDKNTQQIHSIQKSNNIQSSSSSLPTKTNIIPSPIRTSTLPKNKETRRSTSKIPIRSNSSSQPRSHSLVLTTNKRSIPLSTSTINKGAFHFVNTDNNQTLKPLSSSVNNTSLLQDNNKQIKSSDDDDLQTNNLNEDDLKIKLKQEKQFGKQTGELLNKLHENYEELLEKYAQAENTIDQLRFQPKIIGDNTPTSNTSEHPVHIIQQSKINMATLRSSGIYHSTTGSPLSSIRPVTSTTTTTPAKKSISPTNSCTIESVFFDETVPQNTIVQELTTPEIYKLDLIIQIKTLIEKMKSFLTLMDANQLNLSEQKQIYENIKQDYEKLIQIFDQNISDTDFDVDLNKELDIMKQLLKEIVKKVTENLLGKSTNDLPIERYTRLTNDDTHSSQSSIRSSLCNHNDLMNQYQKLLNAINTENTDKNQQIKSVINEIETDSKQSKTTPHDSSRSDLSGDQSPTKNIQKPYVYASGDSDDEQQQSNGIKPIPLMKGIESTSLELDYIPSTSVKYHQYSIEEPTHKYGITTTKKKHISNKQEYNNLENDTKLKRKTKIEQQKITNNRQLNPLILTDGAQYSNNSPRTREYDSRIGTNNITKLSSDSKLYANTMNENHFQSFEDEQESISSSSRSSGSGSVSPRSPYSKYTKRFDNLSTYRRKSTGHSDSHTSDIETHITGSFDPIPQLSSSNKKIHRTYHTSKPEKTSISHRSHLIPFHRSVSIGSANTKNYKMKSFHRLTAPTIYPQANYRSSIYINQPHTHKSLKEKYDQYQSKNLYFDPQTGIIYRYENENPIRIYYHPTSQEKLYRCPDCGSITTYSHRHHINSTLGRITTHLDDLGYESGHKKRNRGCSSSSSSDSDSDLTSSYLEMIALNEAYDRAKKVQRRSRSLSRYITRQLKLALNTI